MKTVIVAIAFILIISFILSRILLKPSKIKNTNPSPTAIITSAIPENLLTAKDLLNSFVKFINDNKTSDAVAFLSVNAAKDEKTKEQWQTNFNSISKITLAKIDDFEKTAWTDKFEQYRVTLDIKLKNKNTENYGWVEGDNIRWITLQKNNKDIWKITEIATGP